MLPHLFQLSSWPGTNPMTVIQMQLKAEEVNAEIASRDN